MKGQKTDNHNPVAKLELRRHFLKKYHADAPPDVLDCCQGSAVLWNQLRSEFLIASYWGIDQKPKKGRLKLDSVRVLAQPGWPQNVVDADTYGSPWKHWEAMLPNVVKPVTVFLTVGMISIGGSPLSSEIRRILMLGNLVIPNAIAASLTRIALPYCLALATTGGLRIVEAVEAVSDGNARYFGVRLEPLPR